MHARCQRRNGIGSVCYGMHVAVADSIVANGGQEIWNYGSPVIVSYTDISRGPQAFYDPNNGVMWGHRNIDADPCFADPGHWDPNRTPGDPNHDSWVDGDYHLKSQGEPVCQTVVAGDLNGDCRVDLKDLAILAMHWLESH